MADYAERGIAVDTATLEEIDKVNVVCSRSDAEFRADLANETTERKEKLQGARLRAQLLIYNARRAHIMVVSRQIGTENRPKEKAHLRQQRNDMLTSEHLFYRKHRA